MLIHVRQKFVPLFLIMIIIATRVAERAMAALKESRKRRRRQDLDVPTWTGRSGTAGAPKMFLMQQQDQERRQQASSSSSTSSSPKPRFGTANAFNPNVVASALPNRFGRPVTGAGASSPGRLQSAGIGSSVTSNVASSSSLLAGMLERKQLEQEAGTGGGRGGSSSNSGLNSPSRSRPSSGGSSPLIDYGSGSGGGDGATAAVLQEGSRENLITKIRDYMLDQGGRVRSADLVGHFQDQLAEVEQLVFKKMLKGIAVLEKSTVDGQGWWKLKPEYY